MVSRSIRPLQRVVPTPSGNGRRESRFETSSFPAEFCGQLVNGAYASGGDQDCDMHGCVKNDSGSCSGGCPCKRNQRPSVTSAQRMTVWLFRKSTTLGSSGAGRGCSTMAVATTASQRSLNAIASAEFRGRWAAYARLRPFIHATLIGLPAAKADGFSPISLRSATRSSSSSSATPVVQLQKPILART